MISFELSEEQKQMQETAHRFAETEMRAQDETYRKCEQSASVPEKMVAAYDENGFGVIDIPEDAGGLAQGLVTRIIVEEELAWGDVGIAMALDRPGLGAAAICSLARAEQATKLLGDLGAKPQTVALCLAEDDLGAEAWGAIATKAEGGKLTGKKRWVVGGTDADLYVVFARTAGGEGWEGVRAFVAERGATGMTLGEADQRMGLLTVPSCTVEFEGTPAEELTGAEDMDAAIGSFLNRARILTAARLVGVARASAEYARDYAMQRPAFGKMIGQFQSIAFMIADAHIEVNSARWLTWKAAAALDAGKDATKEAAMALAHAGEIANRVCMNGVQVLGGAGFIQDYPVEKWLRDARELSVSMGPDAVSDALAADQILGPVTD